MAAVADSNHKTLLSCQPITDYHSFCSRLAERDWGGGGGGGGGGWGRRGGGGVDSEGRRQKLRGTETDTARPAKEQETDRQTNLVSETDKQRDCWG